MSTKGKFLIVLGFGFFEIDLCSHVYSTEIFAKSINDKSMKGCTGCDIYKRFENSNCDCEDEPILGEYVDEDVFKMSVKYKYQILNIINC